MFLRTFKEVWLEIHKKISTSLSKYAFIKIKHNIQKKESVIF